MLNAKTYIFMCTQCAYANDILANSKCENENNKIMFWILMFCFEESNENEVKKKPHAYRSSYCSTSIVFECWMRARAQYTRVTAVTLNSAHKGFCVSFFFFFQRVTVSWEIYTLNCLYMFFFLGMILGLSSYLFGLSPLATTSNHCTKSVSMPSEMR